VNFPLNSKNNKNPNNLKKILLKLPYALIPILFLLGVSLYAGKQTQEKQEYYQIVQYFDTNSILEYTLNLNSGRLEYTRVFTDDKGKEKKVSESFIVPSVTMFLNDVEQNVRDYNRNNPENPVEDKYVTGAASTMLMNILPTALLIVVMGGFLLFMLKRMNNTMAGESNRTLSFGKAKIKQAKDEKRKTTFADVAGADEEKEELSEIVEFLKDPSKFNTLGARIPKGVLLVGPPGTGKTLLARAVAGEADVPFFSISGSDFVEMYVGVGASRVRDLFDRAKKNSPSIIFIDEIDAVGRHRGAGMGGGHDEREQTLNQLLVEMDGFGANEGVIIIAATNRPDILDPALLRPGRFDRQVAVRYPDIRGREDILKVHARGKPLAPDVDLSVISRSTVGFTGADLENLLNEAALLAARRNKKAITMSEIEESTIKVVVGTEKRSHKISDKEKKLTAYHEAGHAVATYYLEGQDPVHQISIIPRGMAGGYTMSMPKEDKSYTSKNDMLDTIVVLMGGRVAEAIVLGDISTGASSDIEKASNIARKMVTKYGMSEKLGPISYGSENDEVFLGRDFSHTRSYSESIASEIDNEVNSIITGAYERTNKILSEHIDKLHMIADELLKNEKIDGETFKGLMSGEQNVDQAETHEDDIKQTD
jgi:cell division protease FtsH